MWEIYRVLNIMCNVSCFVEAKLIGTNKSKEIVLKHLQIAQTFCIERNLVEIIIAGCFLMIPNIKHVSDDVSVAVLNGRKTTSKKQESSSLS